MRSFYLLLVGSLLLGASNAEGLEFHDEEYEYVETSNAELVEASNAEVACTVDDLYSLFNLGATGTNLLPTTGICSGYRALPIAVRQQIGQVGRILLFDRISNTLSAPFCLGLAIAANYEDENPVFYVYDRSRTPVGSLQINSSNITFTLNGQEALFERYFVDDNFDRFQLCSNGTFMNLYLNCSLVASTAFSTTGVSESALISLFTPLFQTTPRFGGALQQLYISSCSANGIPAQVNAQCTSLPAPPTPANACQLPSRKITEVFKQLAPSSSINIDECVSRR